jgi:hypothetical protein
MWLSSNMAMDELNRLRLHSLAKQARFSKKETQKRRELFTHQRPNFRDDCTLLVV